jgi:acyl carrier protein
MTEIQSRLARCYRAIFPDVPDAAVSSTKFESLKEWDSIAIVNLMTVIEEEFGVQLPADELNRLTTFDSALALLNEQGIS